MLACPCCGHLTLGGKGYGNWDICEVCFWEDDLLQLADPTFDGGANDPSLAEAQRNFVEFGAVERWVLGKVKSAKGRRKDTLWRPFNLATDRRIEQVDDFVAPYWIEL
jgi:hypothetical protein